jgi:CBS domain-containing protein
MGGPETAAMKIGRLCNRRVVAITRGERVLEAARRMRDEHVGDLVVVEERAGRRVPVGLLTDRDIVVGLLARDADHLRQLDVEDLLTRDVITAREDDDVSDVLSRMRRQGIRRMPVVDDRGALVGIFTVDDLLGLLSEDLAAIVLLINQERRREVEQRP